MNRAQGRTKTDPKAGGVDKRFRPKMPVIWRPGPWVTAALRAGAPSAALSRGGSYWAHRVFGSEIENQNNWAGQVQVVPLFWSLGPSSGEGLGSRDFGWGRDSQQCRFARETGERVRSRWTKPFRRWRPSTFAHAAVRPELGRFATRSRRGPRRRRVVEQSGAFETRA